MISDNCSIDEFVAAVKHRDAWEALTLAIDEVTAAERRSYRNQQYGDCEVCCSQDYSVQLKELIDYLRFAIKPKRADNKAYQLYMTHWGFS